MEQPNTPQAGENKESKLIGTGEGEVPLARIPFQKIDIRTMNSDISSMKETGGTPAPYTPGNGSQVPQTPQSVPSSSFSIADMSAGQTTPTAPINKDGGKNKKLFLWVIIGLAVLIVVAAAYFFLVPALQGLNGGNQTAETPAPVQNIPAEPQTPSATPEITPTTETPVAALETIDVHASFLKTVSDVVTSEILPKTFTPAGIKAEIQNTTTTSPIFKELIVKTPDNKPLSLFAFGSLFFPNFFTTEMAMNFESDYTLVAYTNTRGTWLTLVAKVKPGSDLAFMKKQTDKLEKETSIKEFYLTDPGDQLSWTAGRINGKSAALLEFATRGVEFSYTWADRYLIISSNVDAAAQVSKKLGL